MTRPTLFSQGVSLFNAARYYEAHEIWEDLWRILDVPEREFLQGLIQAAVGLHHLGSQNFIGADGQLTKSLAKLRKFPGGYYGIDIEGLVGQLERVQRYRVGEVRIDWV